MSAVSAPDRIKKLFHAALQAPPEERATFLAGACAGDDALKLEIESLLTSFAEHQDFLQKPAFDLSAADVAAQVLAEEKGPAIVGAYRIVREIGRGGMGTVYLASRADGHYEQQVAVKLIKRGMDSDEVLKRFRRERQILADLAHPYISRLLDGGVAADGRPFFVMEYVAGSPIGKYANEHQLSTVKRLEVFLLVCTAVEHAHQHQVLHRDLKPGNILITADGTPKLLDFGIAKLLNNEQRNQSGPSTPTALRVLTPEYASPEQLRGLALTAASDVYSLGVVLYELLTGSHPYNLKSRAPQEVLHSVVSSALDKPSKAILRFQSHGNASDRSDLSRDRPLSAEWPSKLRRELRGDLDNILLAALRNEPERRYAAVEQFAEDIRRHLNGSPIVARRDTLAYRGSKFFKRNRAAVISTMVVVFVSLLLGAVLLRGGAHVKPRQSIAVLPFINSSHDPNSDYLADGITDGLIDSLSRLPRLVVPAHSSVFRYKGQTVDTRSLGHTLGVETILTGAVVTDRDNISISVALLDSSNNRALWNKQYSGKSWDLQTIQQEIAREVANKLGVTAADEAGLHPQQGGTQDSEAHRLYLRGNYFWNERTNEGLSKGAAYFQQAIARDPNYALAYCGLANSYSLLGAYEAAPPRDTFGLAKLAAKKALEIDPNLSEGHTSLAMTAWLYDWDWAAADREFKRAIELNPSYPTAHHWYGLYLGEMGRFDEAIAEERQALVLDPVSVPIYADLGRVYFYARRYDESLAQYQKAIELDPGWRSFYAELSYLYAQLGMHEEMIRALEKVDPNPEAKRAFAVSGIKGYWQKSLELSAGQPLIFKRYYAVAELETRLGQNDKAIEQLGEAYKVRDHMITQLRVNPVFDPLRSDPRFLELLRQMKLAP